jgi:hypothetical protein
VSPAFAFQAIVLVVDLQGLLLYNCEAARDIHFCSIVASLPDRRDFCIMRLVGTALPFGVMGDGIHGPWREFLEGEQEK